MLAVVLAAALAAPMQGSNIHFLEDDYPAALARARKEHKPIVSDTWASWCHTCLSMKRYVFPDPGLRPVADAVVWLSIDSENPANKTFVDKFPLDAWPTFLVIDPRDEKVVGRWIGSASVNDFRAFVEQGVEAASAQRKLTPAEALVRKGYDARARADFAGAATAYAAALEKTPASDHARPERLVLLASALERGKSEASLRKCVDLGLREMDRTGNSSVAADFASTVDSCAERLPKDDARAKEARAKAFARLNALASDESAPLSADDRSDIFAQLVGTLDDAGKHDEAVQTARRREALLEKAAAAAPDATLASTFDAHRVDTYLYLGEAAKAEALLVAREKEMPDDYNPAARLARVYFEEKKFPEAEAAVDRALSKMSRGQRRIGVLGLKAKILAAQGKPTSDVVREQLAVFHELPKTQQRAATEERLQHELAQAEKQAGR
jgi:tetratricopeptide (TPR) repeat protein